ncbi:protein shuttle craft [Trichuris trichiura]|uniref:Protein shuttle craft n=1 Tax=Trichuris trichiura TaxID=36087 RepID=A0A077Z8V4_TRITR|nr:protein shuttle craft [Trichuris trichiura]
MVFCIVGLLTQAILMDELECRICLEIVKAEDPIWSCSLCFNIFHFACVKHWTSSSVEQADPSVAPCPTCQASIDASSLKAKCFCGKVEAPILRSDPKAVPHSCGSVCGLGICVHLCPLICHPGSCPPCGDSVELSCFCSTTKRVMDCQTAEPFSVPIQVANVHSLRSCGHPCGRKRRCGVHSCRSRCHPGDCPPCKMDPSVVQTCPCGFTSLKSLGVERKACTDPVPTCNFICSCVLPCSLPDKPHLCQRKCHHGPCSCDLTTFEHCRCGSSFRSVKCSTVLSRGMICRRELWTCRVVCGKRLSCGKHVCKTFCCIYAEHLCRQECGRPLSCGRHTCAAYCHEPPCGQCTFFSHVPVRCTCGQTVFSPPVPCGARPTCNLPCNRPHGCTHEPDHLCHYEASCPPCVVLTEKRCAGGHMVKKVPCSLSYWNCRTVCGKRRASCEHTCQRLCHIGDCLEESRRCDLPCLKARPSCGHPCALPCHNSSECPETPCEADVSCRLLLSLMRLRRRVISSNEFSKLLQNFKSSTKADVISARVFSFAILYECDDECARLSRCRRLAEALGIERSNKPLFPTNYSKFMRGYFVSNSDFVLRVERELCKLVETANQVFCRLSAQARKNGTKSYHFPPMSLDRRRFISEYAKVFSMETATYDQGSQCSVTVYCKMLVYFSNCSSIREFDSSLFCCAYLIYIFQRKRTQTNAAS